LKPAPDFAFLANLGAFGSSLNYEISMSSSPSHEHEKGGKVDVNVKLAEEVYGVGALSGELDRFSSWGLKLRAFVGRFGAEEGGIERVPPEARTDQHPRDLFCFFSSGNCCVTTLGRIPNLPIL